MNCRIGELRNKEVVNVKDGSRLGFVSDVELDTATASLTAVVVYGRLRLFGLLGREPDFIIPWRDIELIGDDAVLVNWRQPEPPKQSGTLDRIWEKLGLSAAPLKIKAAARPPQGRAAAFLKPVSPF